MNNLSMRTCPAPGLMMHDCDDYLPEWEDDGDDPDGIEEMNRGMRDDHLRELQGSWNRGCH